ncbi:MAG: carboxypeptidase-like regulatory domain-containing protein, partial [Bacteroidales bacterium]|nr:carboxypeptidase-like regulatory domain-containing protein [Bacteroidales bacterium]
IDPDLRIVGGLTTELLLDFNLDKSFVLKGNINTPAGIKGFNFKPVIRAVNNSTAGLVQGIVKNTASAVLPNAQVWIAADTTISTAYTDSAGFYALPGIPEGFYSMYATKENYDTVMIGDVEIVAANLTIKDFELTPKN